MHREIAKRIDADPSLLNKALGNIARWSRQMGRTPPALAEWQGLLRTLPWEQIRPHLVEDDEESRRLRQSSPFVGILTQRDAWRSGVRRDEAEHVLRAARVILSPKGDTRFVVIGSNPFWARIRNAPPELLLSMELDLYPMDLPSSDADVVDAVAFMRGASPSRSPAEGSAMVLRFTRRSATTWTA